jgi:hypothetical protein
VNPTSSAGSHAASRAGIVVYVAIQALAAAVGAGASFVFGWRIGGWALAFGFAAMGTLVQPLIKPFKPWMHAPRRAAPGIEKP